MRILLGIQARSNSTRLPGKIYKKLGKVSVLEYLYKRLQLIPNNLKYSLTVKVLGHNKDKRLREFCKKKKLRFFFSSPKVKENDLLGRYLEAVEGYNAVIRITSDCPLLNEKWVEETARLLATGIDYLTNTSPRTVIDGHDCQGITKKGLEFYNTLVFTEEHLFYELENNSETTKKFMKECSIRSLLTMDRMILNPYHPENKLSIDTEEDLERIRKLV